MKQKSRVYTYGVFDLFHLGHLNILKKVREMADYMIVGVYTDKVAESFKRKPIISERERLDFIDALGIADLVVFQDEFSPQANIDTYHPDVVAKARGAGWDKKAPEFRGVKTILLDYTKGISTSEIIKKINDNYIQQLNRENTDKR